MKNNKKTIMYVMLIALFSINNFASCDPIATPTIIFTGVGADAGANQFLGTLIWLKAQGPLAWAAVSPAAPYVIGGTAVLICTYGGYKIYRCYNPTLEQIAKNEQFLAEAAKAHEAQNTLVEEQKALAEQHKVQALEDREKQEALMAKAAFKNCLKNNPSSERNAMGVPSACASSIHAYAMAAGHREAEETMKTFNRYAPQGA
ncbi:MAG: hypothetical protein P4L31_06320 [Candidatus Babeliales bacterium]|nr:hypothetical protein [Candidatus Babeliales bacterium]